MSSKPCHVLLVETSFSGHRFMYFVELAKALHRQGALLSLLSPDPQAVGQALPEGLTPLQNERCPFPYEANPFDKWKQLARWVGAQKAKPSLVFITSLDEYLYLEYGRLDKYRSLVHERIFPFAWAGIHFHPEYAAAQNMLHIYRAKSCRQVFVLDERYEERINVFVERDIAAAFPDFISIETDVLPDDLEATLSNQRHPILASLGIQARRKGFLTLLNMLQLAGPEPGFTVAAFGAWEQKTFSESELLRLKALSDYPHPNILVRPAKVESEGIFNTLLTRVDYVFIGYHDFPHSSNLLTKAAWFRKPVLASRAGLIGQEVVKYQLGEVFDDTDPGQAYEAWRRLQNHRFDEALLAEFTAKHSLHRVDEILSDLVVRSC